jgi:hypothetical protein
VEDLAGFAQELASAFGGREGLGGAVDDLEPDCLFDQDHSLTEGAVASRGVPPGCGGEAGVARDRTDGP